MAKKMILMTLDCETATLPLAEEIAMGNPEIKKRIAIARPLIYDVGWTLMHRDGTIIKRVQHLITETFSVPSVYRTAYYIDKRPLYLAMLDREEIDCIPWREVMKEFELDLSTVDAVGAFNSMFDFKKAIPLQNSISTNCILLISINGKKCNIDFVKTSRRAKQRRMKKNSIQMYLSFAGKLILCSMFGACRASM